MADSSVLQGEKEKPAPRSIKSIEDEFKEVSADHYERASLRVDPRTEDHDSKNLVVSITEAHEIRIVIVYLLLLYMLHILLILEQIRFETRVAGIISIVYPAIVSLFLFYLTILNDDIKSDRFNSFIYFAAYINQFIAMFFHQMIMHYITTDKALVYVTLSYMLVFRDHTQFDAMRLRTCFFMFLSLMVMYNAFALFFVQHRDRIFTNCILFIKFSVALRHLYVLKYAQESTETGTPYSRPPLFSRTISQVVAPLDHSDHRQLSRHHSIFDGWARNELLSSTDDLRKENLGAGIYSIYDLPSWVDRYDYVLNGYRFGYNFSNIPTVCGVHNELGNILTDIIPTVVYLIIFVYYLIVYDAFFIKQTLTTQLIILTSGTFGITVGVFSCFAHLYHSIDKKWLRRAWKTDYFGIIITSNQMAIIQFHCMFYCDGEKQVIFIFMIIILTILSLMTVLKTADDSVREIVLGFLIICATLIPILYHYYLLILGEYYGPTSFTIWISIVFFFFLSMFVAKFAGYPEKYYVRKYIKDKHGQDAFENADENVIKQYMKECADDNGIAWYYILTSHALWHICAHTMLQAVFFACSSYLIWWHQHQC